MNRDAPHPGRPHRLYAALTNHCNRACPWCSTCSSPRGASFLTVEELEQALPAGPFELQLEGGEPTVHPDLFGFAEAAWATGRCARVVLCTNGVALPRDRPRLHAWLARLGAPLTVKLSVNHHLLDEDRGLVALASLLDELLPGGDRDLVINVRLRRGAPGDDNWVRELVERAGLLPRANVFFLQRYGFADGETTWEAPHLAGDGFSMLNPDGERFAPTGLGDGAVLVRRSEGMRLLP